MYGMKIISKVSRNAMLSVVLVAVFVVGLLTNENVSVVNAATSDYQNMGYYYVAKGQVQPYKDTDSGKISVISASGNKYKVSGNIITITCKKSGDIKYKINGKKKYFSIFVGGNGKDSKVNAKEYKVAEKEELGDKKSNNFFEVAEYYMEQYNSNSIETALSGNDLKKWKSANRGIKKNSTFKEVTEKYPSWEDVGTYGKNDCCYAARYYDKKSGICAVKGFVFNSKMKVKKIVWVAYRPETVKLKAL